MRLDLLTVQYTLLRLILIPAALFLLFSAAGADPLLRGQIKGPMLCRKGRDGFRLAAPFRTDSPLPLEALFCLARVEQLEGRPHLVWTFDREGRPRPAPDGRRNGG